MTFAKLMLAAAATSMSVAPAMAAPANPAASLSIAKTARAGSVTAKDNNAVGSGVLIGVAVAVAVIAGIVIIQTSDDDPDFPDSQ